MRAFRSVCLWFVLIAALIGAAPPGKTIVVVGQDDIDVDRPAIQAAIDAAGKNFTVLLTGTFQLDGTEIQVTRGHITIAGERIDDDGDGKINEDWADGEDNDFDGSVDEDDWDAVLKGLTNPDGTPQEGGGIFSLFNRGIQVSQIEGDALQVTVRDLEFIDLIRGVVFAADNRFFPGLYCDDVLVTGGRVVNGVIERNLFVNVTRGAQIVGRSHGSRISDNVVLHAVRDSVGGGAQALLLIGGALFCAEYDDTPRPGGFPIGTPVGTRIEGNLVVDAHRYGIGTIADEGTQVTGNEIRDTSGLYAILFGDSVKMQVQDNTVIGTDWSGITSYSANPGASIGNNMVADVEVGYYFEGSGVRAVNNSTFNVDLDYYLADISSDNAVNLKAGQSCIDDGVDNRVNGGPC